MRANPNETRLTSSSLPRCFSCSAIYALRIVCTHRSEQHRQPCEDDATAGSSFTSALMTLAFRLPSRCSPMSAPERFVPT